MFFQASAFELQISSGGGDQAFWKLHGCLILGCCLIHGLFRLEKVVFLRDIGIAQCGDLWRFPEAKGGAKGNLLAEGLGLEFFENRQPPEAEQHLCKWEGRRR